MDDEDAFRADAEHAAHAQYVQTRAALGGDGRFTDRVEALMTEFPDLTAVFCEELLDFMADKGWLMHNAGLNPDAVDAARQVESRARNAFHLLIAYQANQKSVGDMQMSTRAMALELGYYTAAGADNVAELARKCGLKKQTVNKCAANFQSKLGLPPRPNQRDEPARKTMSRQRKNQLRVAPAGNCAARVND